MVLEHMDMLRRRRIILASASPRRLSILEGIGLHVEVRISDFAEDLPKDSFACGGDYALCTARQKARRVVEQLAQVDGDGLCAGASVFDLLIAADTVVLRQSNRGEVSLLEKATTAAEAAGMLRELRGVTHEVWSGVVLVARDAAGTLHWRELKCRTVVTFAPIGEAEIAAYVAEQKNWEGKAGAYGIQDAAGCLITGIEGDYYNVMGLPLQAVCAELDNLIRDGIVQ